MWSGLQNEKKNIYIYLKININFYTAYSFIFFVKFWLELRGNALKAWIVVSFCGGFHHPLELLSKWISFQKPIANARYEAYL